MGPSVNWSLRVVIQLGPPDVEVLSVLVLRYGIL